MTRRSGRHFWPELTYNPITVIGGGLALFALSAIAIFFFLSLTSRADNPYNGIFMLVVFPLLLVVGLLLVPLGMYLEKRRRDRGDMRRFVVDLRDPSHRRALFTFGMGTALFLLITTIGLYETYHFTESVTFCGEVCHVMDPEHTAYLASSHARVACVHCHVGPGGVDYLESKMAGARQLWHFMRGDYHRPIETPVYTLRPARETCEECHWSNTIHRPTVVVRDHFLSTRDNRQWRIELLFNTARKSAHTGIPGIASRDSAESARRAAGLKVVSSAGPAAFDAVEPAGIHWHLANENPVTYVARDSSRQSFEQVTWIRNGKPVTYTADGAPLSAAELEIRTKKGLVRSMDCMDCHNRPAHRYLSPIEAVNRALEGGTLNPEIPWIKREAVRALSGEWKSPEEAHEAIARHLEGFYSEQGIELASGTVPAVQAIYDNQMFPSMRVRWDEYPENHGHLQFPGCFRCHGSELKTAEGETIRADCNLCHTLLSQHFVDEGPVSRVRFEEFRHPIEIQGAETVLHCTDCHGGDAQLYKAQK